MGADQRVPATAVDYLYPGEVDLYQSRAAPLARFEHDQAQRMSGAALGLKKRCEPALRTVEAERDVARGDLVGDHYAADGPEGEVISEPQAG